MKAADDRTRAVRSRRLRDAFIDTATGFGRLLPKGRTTIFRLAHWAVGQPSKIIGTVDHQRFCVDVKDEGISLRAYLMDAWEPEVSRVMCMLLKPGSTFVDVGANKGYFCLLAAKRVLPNGRVISYEPHPGNATDIDTTIEENGYRHWTNRAVAASSEVGAVKFYTPGWADGMSGWGSIHRPCDSFIEVQRVLLADDLAAQQIQLVDLLKIDVEGHEIQVLEGASAWLATGRISNLLVEVHLTELESAGISRLFELMSSFRYHPYTTVEGKKSLRDATLCNLLRPVTCSEIQMIEKSPRNRPHVVWSKETIA